MRDNYTLEEFFDYKNFSAGFNRRHYQSWAYAMKTTITWLDITEVQPSSGVKVLYLYEDNIYTGYIAYAESDEKPANPIEWDWEICDQVTELYSGVRYWAEIPELP